MLERTGVSPVARESATTTGAWFADHPEGLDVFKQTVVSPLNGELRAVCARAYRALGENPATTARALSVWAIHP